MADAAACNIVAKSLSINRIVVLIINAFNFSKAKSIVKNLVFLLLLICFLVSSAAASHAAETQTRFPLVYGAMSGNTVPLWLAKEQGFFRKYGLDPQLIFIIAGRAAQAMLSGEINIGVIGATHVTNAVTSGGDMTMLLGLETKLDYFSRDLYVMFVKSSACGANEPTKK